MTTPTNTDFIDTFQTIPQMLEHAVATWPEREAYRQFDYAENAWLSITWKTFYEKVLRWRRAFVALGYQHGDRAAMLLTNSIDAVTFDEAAIGNGMVPVPLHAIDTAGSSAYILHDSGARFLITTSIARWNAIAKAAEDNNEALDQLDTVVFINEVMPDDAHTMVLGHRVNLLDLESWLARGNTVTNADLPAGPTADDLCELVYTSGTTGRPKGVMITHSNIVANLRQANAVFEWSENDVFLSFLPFSHTFERTVTHYNAIAHGAAMAFSRGVAHIEDDLHDVQPTIMCTVPRVLEMIYQRVQNELLEADEVKRRLMKWTVDIGWRRFCQQNDLPVEPSDDDTLDENAWPTLDADIASKVRSIFGEPMRAVIAGGASLNYDVSKFFCAMRVPIHQGYGLTETSPLVAFSRRENNHPACVGHPVPWTEAKLGANDELLLKGPQIMKGYWNRPDATKAAFIDGWFKTGDQADLSDGGRIRIKGRIKEIIVTSTGEKIAPVDLEFAIQKDPLFQQIMVIGDNRPYITAIAVVNEQQWKVLCESMELDPAASETLTNHDMQRLVVKRIRHAARNFPQYGIPRVVALVREGWTIDNGLLTPTMKLRRPQIMAHYASLIESLYR